jgi:hypothetical protein
MRWRTKVCEQARLPHALDRTEADGEARGSRFWRADAANKSAADAADKARMAGATAAFMAAFSLLVGAFIVPALLQHQVASSGMKTKRLTWHPTRPGCPGPRWSMERMLEQANDNPGSNHRHNRFCRGRCRSDPDFSSWERTAKSSAITSCFGPVQLNGGTFGNPKSLSAVARCG